MKKFNISILSALILMCFSTSAQVTFNDRGFILPISIKDGVERLDSIIVNSAYGEKSVEIPVYSNDTIVQYTGSGFTLAHSDTTRLYLIQDNNKVISSFDISYWSQSSSSPFSRSEYRYKENGLLDSIITESGVLFAGSERIQSRYFSKYTYNENNLTDYHTTMIVDWNNDTTIDTTVYKYDEFQQLIEMENINFSYKTTYEYNENGNISKMTELFHDVLNDEWIEFAWHTYHWSPLMITQSKSITKNEVVCYPSPAKDIITFDGMDDISEITIINTSGQVLTQRTLSGLFDQVELDVSNLAPGTYVARVIGDDSTKSVTFIKE